MERSKLPWRIRIGYGLCTTADAVPYDLFYIYFIFYLTDIVGVAALTAGAISFIAVVWDGIIDPVIGGLSDAYVTKKGRRLPWMKVSVLPLAAVIYFAFAPIEIKNAALQSVYYVVIPMLIWLFYSTFMIPYYALGAEITKDYNERNILRFMTVFAGYIALAFVSSGPMWIWSWAGAAGYGDRQAWGLIGAVFAVFIVIICYGGIYLMRDCEKASLGEALKAKSERVRENVYKVWLSCLREKSFKKIAIWIMAYSLGFVMVNSICVYLMTHNVGLDAAGQATFWVVYTLIVIAAMPFITLFANKYGKKPVMLAAMGPLLFAAGLFYLIGIETVAALYIYAGLWGTSSAAFFTFYVAFAYDCVEIVEYQSGVRREGSMTAIASLAYQVGSALGMYAVGAILGLFGYDGTVAVQSEEARRGILLAATIIPGFFSLCALAVLATYKVSKHKYELLCAATARKKAGEAYSAAGFEDIL